MILCPAKPFDIDGIMAVERSAFIPQIQEKQSVFEARMRAFPQGFLVLTDSSASAKAASARTGGNSSGAAQTRIVPAVVAGYFCSELWNALPSDDGIFTLGHDALSAHRADGTVLYASSFALLPAYRGQKLGTPFFKAALCAVTAQCPQIQTAVLLVNREWTGAHHIYEELGFADVRVLPGFFPSLHAAEGSDGIIMTAQRAADGTFMFEKCAPVQPAGGAGTHCAGGDCGVVKIELQ